VNPGPTSGASAEDVAESTEARAGKLPSLGRSREQGLDVPVLFASREVDLMAHRDYLVLDAAWARRFERYATLKHDGYLQTVAFFEAALRSSNDNAADRPDVTSPIPSGR
jgi:hypothetical protein